MELASDLAACWIVLGATAKWMALWRQGGRGGSAKWYFPTKPFWYRPNFGAGGVKFFRLLRYWYTFYQCH